MKGLRQILRVSWIAKRTNEWVLEKAGVTKTLLATVKARKMRYFGHIMRTNGNCLEKEIIQGTLPGRRARGRPKISWMDNIKTWTGLEPGNLLRAADDRLQWRSIVHGVANPRIEDG